MPTRSDIVPHQRGLLAVATAFGILLGLAGPLAAQDASVCPDNFAAFAGTTDPLACVCTDEAVERGSVWGMDVYTGDSSICRAARHAGIVGKAGGPVTVVPAEGRKAYAGVTRNGVSSSNYGNYGSSFRFGGAASATAPAPAPRAPETVQTAAGASVCPDNFAAFAETTDPLACTCTPEAADRGPVWGMDVYTADSSICRAARHAGIISKAGGSVTVLPEAGRKAYAGVTRNGVSSSNYGTYASSFRFNGGAAATPATASAESGGRAAASSDCPDNFAAFAETTDPLACTCSAEAADRGPVWGMDVYTGDSSICRAARHAGVITKAGGAVTVLPEAGRKAYPGVTRNGVSSSNYGTYASSFRFAAAAAPPAPAPAPPAPPPATAPVQQPIAETLKAKGEVALYIRFRTGSAELDPQTIPILEELLATLKGQSDLNLGLIGHTDAVGARDYNRTLSYRRAESVRFWLADRGVSLSRITVDGKGFDEPLADNATEQGRAMNRRVQAKRLP